MIETLVLAANFRALGLTVAAVVVIAFIAVFIWNVSVAKPELGSEIELAANRKPYLTDEELEGPKLDKALSFALIVLGVCSLALPFYWLAEPGRQDGAVEAYLTSFESRGKDLYLEGAQCVNCHSPGGVGGGKDYVLQDADGQFVANAVWNAPALNDVLNRYSDEEVTYILNYGRPGSPMAAWGTPGGGPLTTQQVQNLIEYLRTLQVQSLDVNDIDQSADPEAAQDAADALSAEILAEVDRSLADGEFDTVGEAVFNLGLFSDFQNGSNACARCHTAGWSLGLTTQPNILNKGVAGCGGGNPSGIGFNLCNGSTLERFPDDTWKMPDGSWLPLGGLVEDVDGVPTQYLLSMDNEKVWLNSKGAPVTSRLDDGGEPIPYLVIDDGDLADCRYVSQLWTPATGQAYPFAQGEAVAYGIRDDGTTGFIDPEELTLRDLSSEAFALSDGRLVDDCTVVDMPERTSQAHYDFIYDGSVAGAGYGNGGQGSGRMPGFGKSLPPELIQAVVDYERGL